MARRDEEMPRTQTSAPVQPARTTADPAARDEPGADRAPHEAGDERGDRGDRMPKGADEPGAGL
jgi:hypothetical protein